MNDPTLRASDAERDRVVVQLEHHTAQGRLTLDEYAERVDRVLASRTHGDLAAVTADLPAEEVVLCEQNKGERNKGEQNKGEHKKGEQKSEDDRHLLWAFLVAAAVLLFFTVVLGLAR